MEAYKSLFPELVSKKFLSAGAREDGRALESCRPVSLAVRMVGTCHGSAVLRMEGTIIFAGVTCSVAEAGTPLQDLVSIDVKLTPLSSPRFRQPRASTNDAKRNAAVATFLREVLLGSAALTTEALLIQQPVGANPDQGAATEAPQRHWHLAIDVIFTSVDGSIEDSALVATVAALNSTVFPALDRRAGAGDIQPRRLALHVFPVAVTHAVVSPGGRGDAAGEQLVESEEGEPQLSASAPRARLLLADPTSPEEDISDALVTVVVDASEAVQRRVERAAAGTHNHAGDGLAAESSSSSSIPAPRMLGLHLHGTHAVSVDTIAECVRAAAARVPALTQLLADAAAAGGARP